MSGRNTIYIVSHMSGSALPSLELASEVAAAAVVSSSALVAALLRAVAVAGGVAAVSISLGQDRVWWKRCCCWERLVADGRSPSSSSSIGGGDGEDHSLRWSRWPLSTPWTGTMTSPPPSSSSLWQPGSLLFCCPLLRSACRLFSPPPPTGTGDRLLKQDRSFVQSFLLFFVSCAFLYTAALEVIQFSLGVLGT